MKCGDVFFSGEMICEGDLSIFQRISSAKMMEPGNGGGNLQAGMGAQQRIMEHVNIRENNCDFKSIIVDF